MCTWNENDDSSWDTTCGHCFEFIEGDPLENGMKFCCFCGGPLVSAPFVYDYNDDDPEED